MRVSGSRGASLLELMVACAIGTIVLAAGVRTLLAVRRFWFAEREALAVHAAARAATGILAAELRGVSPRSGDLLRISDTAATIRAPRALLVACAAPAAGALTVARDRALAPRTPVAARESVLVFLAADGGDRWAHYALGAVGGGTCPDGGPGWRLDLLGPAAALAALDSVAPGAPVRTFETAAYRLYDDGTRTWWLGVRTWQGAGWSATSPLAGPLRARDGLALGWLDQAGAPAPDTLVRLVAITARAVGAASVWAPGRHAGPATDSITVLVAPRN